MVMKKIALNAIFASSMLIYGVGCSNKALPQSRVGSISQSYVGVIKAVESVKVRGDGTWSSMFGMIIGGVLGHQIGGGSGKDLATMGGSVAGTIVGAEADIDDAQRITVEFESGKTITTILPIDANNPNRYRVGDRVTVYITGDKVTEIR
jgi:outer membrane lipoprotein SlyB